MGWICASCGTEHTQNDPPCRDCGGERFAELAADEFVIDSMADVQWACKQCGRIHQRNNPPCNDCGGMQFATIEDMSGWGDSDSSPTASSAGSPTANSETDQTAYYIGVLSGFAGVLFLPFIFVFVAIVESPLRLFGRSIGTVLSSDGDTNDGIRGAMQAFAWSGHLFWGLFILGFVLGFLLLLFN